MTSDPTDDTVPAWSAFGKTMDGFSKPDMAAPGRYMIAPAPMNGKIALTVPERIMAPGYMWMSGTSFSTPAVAAAAAQILARHPDYTPDKVKGALMLSANYLPLVNDPSAGVGEIDAAVATSLIDPPNPNEGLYQFVSSSGSSGQKQFDSASWAAYVRSGASWAQASWASATWASASWSAASWAAASWSEASFSASLDGLMASMASYSESTFTP
jgi:serine protease AprX